MFTPRLGPRWGPEVLFDLGLVAYLAALLSVHGRAAVPRPQPLFHFSAALRP